MANPIDTVWTMMKKASWDQQQQQISDLPLAPIRYDGRPMFSPDMPRSQPAIISCPTCGGAGKIDNPVYANQPPGNY